MNKAGWFMVGVVATSCVYATPHADAQESCAAHLAKHGVSKAVDIAEHRAGIQPGKSPCDTGEEAAQASHRESTEKRSDDRSDGKSRYCRKRWWC